MKTENTVVTLKQAFEIMKEKKFRWRGEVLKTSRPLRTLYKHGKLSVIKTMMKNKHELFLIDRDYLYKFIEDWNAGEIKHRFNFTLKQGESIKLLPPVQKKQRIKDYDLLMSSCFK